MENTTKYIAGIVVMALIGLTAFALTYDNPDGTGFLIAGSGSIAAGSGSSVPNTGSVGNVATGNPAEGEDPFFGSPDAAVTIIEYSDFQCPFCARALPVLDQIKSVYGNSVKVVFKDFPLSFHQFAQKAAEAGQCASDQGKFWELHDEMFANQGRLDVPSIKGYAASLGLDTEQFNECLDSGKYRDEVLQDFNDGRAAGVSGTPTFFINGKKIVGAQPFEEFQKVIDKELGSLQIDSKDNTNQFAGSATTTTKPSNINAASPTPSSCTGTQNCGQPSCAAARGTGGCGCGG